MNLSFLDLLDRRGASLLFFFLTLEFWSETLGTIQFCGSLETDVGRIVSELLVISRDSLVSDEGSSLSSPEISFFLDSIACDEVIDISPALLKVAEVWYSSVGVDVWYNFINSIFTSLFNIISGSTPALNSNFINSSIPWRAFLGELMWSSKSMTFVPSSSLPPIDRMWPSISKALIFASLIAIWSRWRKRPSGDLFILFFVSFFELF